MLVVDLFVGQLILTMIKYVRCLCRVCVVVPCVLRLCFLFDVAFV